MGHLEWISPFVLINIGESEIIFEFALVLFISIFEEIFWFRLELVLDFKLILLNKEEVCIHIINKMIKLYSDSFKERYKLDNIDIDIVELLDIIGKNIGAIRNKETDYEKVYTVILKDLREGYLGRVTFDEYENR